MLNHMGTRSLVRLKLRWEDGWKREVEKMKPGIKWKEAAKDRDRWQSLSLAVWSLRPKEEEDMLHKQF